MALRTSWGYRLGAQAFMGLLLLGSGILVATPETKTLAQPIVPSVTSPLAQTPEAPEAPGWLPQLNLTPQQMRQLRAIQQQNQGDLSQKTQELRQTRQELRDLMVGEAPAAEIRAHYRRLQQLSQEISQQRFEVILRVREILTPNQREQLVNFLDSRPPAPSDQMRNRRPRLRP